MLLFKFETKLLLLTVSVLFASTARADEKPADAGDSYTRQQTLFESGAKKIIWSQTRIKTEPTNVLKGSLVTLTLTGTKWRETDSKTFYASGKHAHFEVEMTSWAGIGYVIGGEGNPVAITLTVTQGGRGFGYRHAQSFGVRGGQITPLPLEQQEPRFPEN